MKQIDSIAVQVQSQTKFIKLYVGDLSRIPADEAVDLLVVSAFPNDYLPTPTSLIGALHRVGVSVTELSSNIACDLRSFSSCWISHPITNEHTNFHRLLCFEPHVRGSAPEVVGDIFRSLVPLATANPPIRSVAMPVLASGDQGESPEVMLEALLNASIHWLSTGIPLDVIKIVLKTRSRPLKECFSNAKQDVLNIQEESNPSGLKYDVFVSYSHCDEEAMLRLIKLLKAGNPRVKPFVDRLELMPGEPWQKRIFEAIESSRKAVCFFSPDYVTSKVCIDEFNAAVALHRQKANRFLYPIYLYETQLLPNMEELHYCDLRQGCLDKLDRSASQILKFLKL